MPLALIRMPDYPYPLTELTGVWRVEPVEEGSKVSLEFIARAKCELGVRLA